MAIKKSLDYGFDYLLYPVTLLWLGYLWGGILMTAASVVLNLATIRAYDWSRRHWLLIETIKQLRDEPEGLAAHPLVNWIVRKAIFRLLHPFMDRRSDRRDALSSPWNAPFTGWTAAPG